MKLISLFNSFLPEINHLKNKIMYLLDYCEDFLNQDYISEKLQDIYEICFQYVAGLDLTEKEILRLKKYFKI